MKYRIFSAVVALLCTGLGFSTASQAGGYGNYSDVSISVIGDNGRHYPMYPAGGHHQTQRSWLEARRGRNYGISIRNNTNERVGVVIAVDGRNIISGKSSNLSQRERMYILEPYKSTVYRGWRSSRNQVNRFYFTDYRDSYAYAWNDTARMGVIAAAVYRERAPYYQQPPQKERRRGPSWGDQSHRNRPGTGYGYEERSPSIRVEFQPEVRASSRHFIRYEWHEGLCRRGVIDCGQHRYRDRQPPRRRPYYDDGYAPPPPSKYYRGR
ncbi:MAG: hypothetical protein AAF512_05635 [Pseudomonadota bacterium]